MPAERPRYPRIDCVCDACFLTKVAFKAGRREMSGLFLFGWPVRLLVRIPVFQAGESGSTPLRATRGPVV